MSKTIKELADTLEVSKTAIRKHMSEDFRSRYTKTNSKGVITINSAGCRLISVIMGREQVFEDSEDAETENLEVITLPKEVYEDMRAELTRLRKRDEELTNKILAISGDVSGAIKALSQEGLADKIIEGNRQVLPAAPTLDLTGMKFKDKVKLLFK